MPIDYKEYHPKWTLIRRLIHKRAKGKCEKCHLMNGTIIKREIGGKYRFLCAQEWDMVYSRIKYQQSNLTESLKFHGFTKIVLSVAHIDRDKTNNRFSNLAALCQCCHITHDIHQHVANRKYGIKHKAKHQLKLL